MFPLFISLKNMYYNMESLWLWTEGSQLGRDMKTSFSAQPKGRRDWELLTWCCRGFLLEVKRKDLTTHLLVKGGPWIMQTTQKPNSIFLFNEYKFIFIIKKEQCKITTFLLRPGLLCCYRHCCLLHNFMTLILSTKLILFIVLFVMPLNVIF